MESSSGATSGAHVARSRSMPVTDSTKSRPWRASRESRSAGMSDGRSTQINGTPRARKPPATEPITASASARSSIQVRMTMLYGSALMGVSNHMTPSRSHSVPSDHRPKFCQWLTNASSIAPVRASTAPRWLTTASVSAGAEDQDVLVDDVRDEGARVAVRPEARAGLVPDQVALGDETDTLGSQSQVRA